ncbi:hypothetical protein A1Q2_03878 [Trichosporon asahii var. asahii CBS 8904]|uniref:Uncharacterized protein n=1 Tax=Trichosporon asahii var. asahii (strain CBS 8904) TaxID=1220162 RepID=K1VCW5_TRIAC|nr:hypothetical protein A1Q2_03878 [Trichosporon asahii var. asahii CBS 8904]
MQAPSYRGSRNALCVGKVDDALNLGTVTIGSDENNKGTMRAHGQAAQAKQTQASPSLPVDSVPTSSWRSRGVFVLGRRALDGMLQIQ